LTDRKKLPRIEKVKGATTARKRKKGLKKTAKETHVVSGKKNLFSGKEKQRGGRKRPRGGAGKILELRPEQGSPSVRQTDSGPEKKKKRPRKNTKRRY